jgi:DNA-directed RNA polymerase specialized sigma24 family protein
MSNSAAVTAHLPYLRRYARALTGSQKSGDAYVVAALEAIVADPSTLSGPLGPRVALYRDFSKILNSVELNSHPVRQDLNQVPQRAEERNLAAMTPRARQAFLLLCVEEFSIKEVAEVLDTNEDEVRTLIDQAGREIAQQVATNVVIIEDEPLIAMDLERLVQELGHQVSRIARTHKQAVAAVKTHRPGLVLADIQLADGSSGLEAVNEFLASFEVPVIFVTAYPEQLLTGDRPEPTFLVTKPFKAETIKAVVSQALFFDANARLPKRKVASR